MITMILRKLTFEKYLIKMCGTTICISQEFSQEIHRTEMQCHGWKTSWGQAVLQDEQDGEMWEIIEKVGWGRLSLF